jgi:hypothetical protein
LRCKVVISCYGIRLESRCRLPSGHYEPQVRRAGPALQLLAPES